MNQEQLDDYNRSILDTVTVQDDASPRTLKPGVNYANLQTLEAAAFFWYLILDRRVKMNRETVFNITVAG